MKSILTQKRYPTSLEKVSILLKIFLLTKLLENLLLAKYLISVNADLTIAIDSISSKDNSEECVIHSKSDNIEIMTYDNAGEVIEDLFESLFKRYQIGLETSMKGSDFIFDCAQLLCYK